MTRRALLIATATYEDREIADLPSARRDIEELGSVLEDPAVGRYVVEPHVDLGAEAMRAVIRDFCGRCEEEDVALIVVTGHGVLSDTDDLVLVATDTRRSDVGSGVRAEFINERLDDCIADNRILLLDACHAGAFTLGFRSSGTKSLTPESAPQAARRLRIQDRGVHILMSSDATELSFERQVDHGGAALSVFIGSVVDVLREGAAGSSTRDFVSVEDLFQAVTSRLAALDPPQTPVHSALRSAGQIALAYLPDGVARDRDPEQDPGSAAESAELSGEPSVPEVLRYFGTVVADEARMGMLPADGDSHVLVHGMERALTGRGTGFTEPDLFPVPDEAVDLVERAVSGDGGTLWAGWPCVVRWTRSGAEVAPLFIRRVELRVPGALRPVGEAILHPGLVAGFAEEDAAQLQSAFRPRWRRGEARRMAEQAGAILYHELGLPITHQLDADALATDLGLTSPGDGTRNAAVLFVDGAQHAITAGLRKDLSELSRNTQVSAMDSLFSPDADAEPQRRPVRIVTPLPTNPAQRRVLDSAMTRRLTVATGPPGTGKSQLVANAVATAICAGQSVLVASTNNEAVNEVHRRCADIEPGMLIRTGNKTHRKTEPGQITPLLAVDDRQDRTVETLRIELDHAAQELAQVETTIGVVAAREQALVDAAARIEELETGFRCSAADLTARLGPGWGARSHRLATAWFLGRFRRRRWLDRAGVPERDESRQRCIDLSRLADAQDTWERLLDEAERAPSDHYLRSTLEHTRADHRDRSVALVRRTVRDRVAAGRHHVERVARGDASWAERASALPFLGGWAATSLTARVFGPTTRFDLVIIDEASQCAVAAVLPLLYRARRALVIGDPMQLPHICKLAAATDRRLRAAHGVPSRWLVEHRMSPRRHSAFDAAAHAAGETLLLDEHYRCAPAIADLSNRLFYSGRLTVLTDVHAPGRLPASTVPIRWLDVRGRPGRGSNGSSWRNLEEARAAAAVARELQERRPRGTSIGVVTPYRAQAELIHRELGDRAAPATAGADDPRIRVGSAHIFQGGERDVIVYSLVAADDGGNPRRFDWAARQRRLWNVAITRARSELVVVGDLEHWQARGGVGADLASASESHAGVGIVPTEDWQRRLHRSLITKHADVELGVPRYGYRADAVVTTRDGRDRAVLLDTGAGVRPHPGEHLQMMLRRTELVGADRLPAWRILSGDGPGNRRPRTCAGHPSTTR
ncbi:AAA domain-containing protein [Pseudonocardia sp. NPDC046786]|uniref:AAA domain-containing protein n=1 Tax=Pseudonocardia sp. NPDC046786 TaxID=3155471 RepID=UPI0033D1F93E